MLGWEIENGEGGGMSDGVRGRRAWTRSDPDRKNESQRDCFAVIRGDVAGA
jgi:hypothetical protein